MMETNAMIVEGKGKTAEQAHALVAALVEVFLERQIALNGERLADATANTKASLSRAKQRAKNAAERYQVFRSKNGPRDVVAEYDQAASDILKMGAAADAQAIEATAQQARVKELQKSLRTLPKQIVASATRSSPIDAPLAKARAELAGALATLSEEHPRVIALRERVANLEAQKKNTNNEVGARTLSANPARELVQQSLATARAAYAAASRKEKSLRRLVERARATAQRYDRPAAQGRSLKAELDAARSDVGALEKKSIALKDAAASSPSGFVVVAQPTMPTHPKSSATRAALLWAPPLIGALLAAIALFGQELRGLRVRTASEVAWWGSGPVLGTSQWPRQPDALQPFVDELEDVGVRGVGRTLVVPATELERDLACDFAVKLAEAPWLAAAILDVRTGRRPMQRSGYPPQGDPILTPSPQHRLPVGVTGAPPSSAPGAPSQIPPGTAPVTMRPVGPRRNTLDGMKAARNTPVIYAKPPADELDPEVRPSTSRPPAKTIQKGIGCASAGRPKDRHRAEAGRRHTTHSTQPPAATCGRVGSRRGCHSRSAVGETRLRSTCVMTAQVRMVVHRRGSQGCRGGA